jgi:hypothetical protein
MKIPHYFTGMDRFTVHQSRLIFGWYLTIRHMESSAKLCHRWVVYLSRVYIRRWEGEGDALCEESRGEPTSALYGGQERLYVVSPAWSRVLLGEGADVDHSLANRAMLDVLKVKVSRFKYVVDLLSNHLDRQHRGTRKSLDDIARRGWAAVKGAKF